MATRKAAAPEIVDSRRDGLPCLLLRLDIRQEFGRRHRIGVVAGRFKLGPGCRIKDCLPQVVAQLAHNRVGRSDRGDQSEPAAGTEAWKCLRDGWQVWKVRQPLGRANGELPDVSS